LEGLRGLAALYVVISHIFSMSDPSELAWKASAAPEWFQDWHAWFKYGHLAVAAFIVLSGFCLQLSLFSRADGRIGKLGAWTLRRMKRILPPYYGALALSIWVALTVTVHQPGMPFQHYLPVTNENVLAHVFLVHNLSTDWMYKINGVMWSIGIEAQLYLLFPLLVAAVFRIGRVPTFLLTVAAAALVIAYVPNAPKLYPWYLPLFVLGMLSAHFAYRPNLRAGTQPFLALLVASGGFYLSGYASTEGWALYWRDAFVGLGVASLCYLLTVTEEGVLCRTLALRPLVALGGFSYSLYLMHHPIQQVVFAHRPAGVEGEVGVFWYLLLYGLPLMVLGSYLFSLVFERPFLPRRVVERERGLVPTSLPLATVSPNATRIPQRDPAPRRRTERKTVKGR
jgi:peptidoglycan/LPS O-acetylase OafA/YrhL